jgi:uroporphyrinogen decarboxylase
MLIDDPELTKNVFDSVGSRLLEHYRISASFDTVGALIVNDDWGFKTQTMISPADMRKYIIPWHKKIVNVIHETGKPAIMHSCGKLDEVMEDIINVIKFDGKHSYEDIICPVETAYEKLAGRIAVLGGIDIDFLCKASPSEITRRSKVLIEKGMKKGGYALGSGNSIPEYISDENYFAMINTVTSID